MRLFINVSYNLNYKKAKLMGSPPLNRSEYDYIVVGSGTSGSVVVGRLAEAGHRILLVEAGGPPHFLQVRLSITRENLRNVVLEGQ